MIRLKSYNQISPIVISCICSGHLISNTDSSHVSGVCHKFEIFDLTASRLDTVPTTGQTHWLLSVDTFVSQKPGRHRNSLWCSTFGFYEEPSIRSIRQKSCVFPCCCILTWLQFSVFVAFHLRLCCSQPTLLVPTRGPCPRSTPCIEI